MLSNEAWQPVPGALGAEIYPYIRTPDLLSSNSCLLRTAEQIILIDAGALDDQSAEMDRLIDACLRDGQRPVILYLTHCHIDQSLGAHRRDLARETRPIRIAVQEEGVKILAEGNRHKTIAELYGTFFPPFRPDIPLLTVRDREHCLPRRFYLSSDAALTVETEKIATGLEAPLYRQVIPIGGGDHLEVFPAPGHSPDGICIRIGQILFIGDLLVAASPMVAGISGWNRDDYLRTLHQVAWLLENHDIRLCCPGHGGFLVASSVRNLLKELAVQAGRLGDVAVMNEGRLLMTTEFALELIDEAEEVFSAIAGRLFYVAYHLDELEESAAADRCRTAMDMDRIDACLAEFRRHCETLKKGGECPVEFVHTALRIVQKIKKLFNPRPLEAIMAKSLVNRATRLLIDFIGIAHGVRNPEEFIPVDLNAMLAKIILTWQMSPHSDASIIDTAHDPDRYLMALTARIGHEPIAEKATLQFTPCPDLPMVYISAARFSDTLTHFLEWLTLGEASGIRLMTGMGPEQPFIRIVSNRKGAAASVDRERRFGAFTRRFGLCGLLLRVESDGFKILPVSGCPDRGI